MNLQNSTTIQYLTRLGPNWEKTSSIGSIILPGQLLAALRASQIGFAICDRQFRFRAINKTFSAFTGVPPENHVGKHLREVLADAAGKILPVLERVFETGVPVPNFELKAVLPGKSSAIHWINY